MSNFRPNENIMIIISKVYVKKFLYQLFISANIIWKIKYN